MLSESRALFHKARISTKKRYVIWALFLLSNIIVWLWLEIERMYYYIKFSWLGLVPHSAFA